MNPNKNGGTKPSNVSVRRPKKSARTFIETRSDASHLGAPNTERQEESASPPPAKSDLKDGQASNAFKQSMAQASPQAISKRSRKEQFRLVTERALDPEYRIAVTPEAVDTIIQLLSGDESPTALNSDEELNTVRLFMREVSHKRAGAELLLSIDRMDLLNQREVLERASGRVQRHLKNENLRTALNALYKFCRIKAAFLSPAQLETLNACRHSELETVKICTENREFHVRIIQALESPALREHCLSQLRSQLGRQLLPGALTFLRAGKWKARFVSFPVELEQARQFFVKIVKNSLIAEKAVLKF